MRVRGKVVRASKRDAFGIRLQNDHVVKSDLKLNKFSQVVKKSGDFVLCWFGFVEAVEFRDWSNFRLWEKRLLPCQYSRTSIKWPLIKR